MKPKMHETMLK